MPDAIESFQDVAAKLLLDRHHGVLLTGVALMMEICAVDPAAVEAYRRHVPQLCNIMRSLLMSGFAPEHDVSGITDPFLQVKVGVQLAGGMNKEAGSVATNSTSCRCTSGMSHKGPPQARSLCGCSFRTAWSLCRSICTPGMGCVDFAMQSIRTQ